MSKMFDTLNLWKDRIDNALDFQKDWQVEIVPMRFNRMELIELRMIIRTLEELMDDKDVKE